MLVGYKYKDDCFDYIMCSIFWVGHGVQFCIWDFILSSRFYFSFQTRWIEAGPHANVREAVSPKPGILTLSAACRSSKAADPGKHWNYPAPFTSKILYHKICIQSFFQMLQEHWITFPELVPSLPNTLDKNLEQDWFFNKISHFCNVFIIFLNISCANSQWFHSHAVSNQFLPNISFYRLDKSSTRSVVLIDNGAW